MRTEKVTILDIVDIYEILFKKNMLIVLTSKKLFFVGRLGGSSLAPISCVQVYYIVHSTGALNL